MPLPPSSVPACLIALLLLRLACLPAGAGTGTVVLFSDPAGTVTPAAASEFPAPDARGNRELRLHATNWVALAALTLEIETPAAATGLQAMVFVQDWDHLWYQKVLPDPLQPGTVQTLVVELFPSRIPWQPVGHTAAWNLRALCAPVRIGMRIFGGTPDRPPPRLRSGTGTPRRDEDPPTITGVRPSHEELAAGTRFELRCELPDRYPVPFDPEDVDLEAVFHAPSGTAIPVHGFYTRQHVRVAGRPRMILPTGAPYWCVRFTPTETGVYRYTLRVRDRYGSGTWGPGYFTATPPATPPAFIRVSPADPRWFETSSGAFFYPLGHNLRSPFDVRYFSEFPWRERAETGTDVYPAYFEKLRAAGGNFVEIWSAAWSLGLEWSPAWKGYHGIGQYNLVHAWEMDRVLESAEANGIYLNYVVHNHGKFGDRTDKEWPFNPFNTVNGGYLTHAGEYFSDPRAIRSFKNLMRYTIARWGCSPNLFAWELWSELNLAGTHKDNHRRPEVIDWHRRMGRWIKEEDPYDHLVSTHYSGDYRTQSEPIVLLPEMDHCPVDAYHTEAESLHILDLVRGTAAYNNPLGKPVLITEFGGSSRGNSYKHLVEALHAATWICAGVPLGGAPMFWWWQLIEEQNLYPVLEGFARFRSGEDLRDPSLRPVDVTLLHEGRTDPTLAGDCLASSRRAYGWIHHADAFGELAPAGEPRVLGRVLRIPGFAAGDYDCEFWDTQAGQVFTMVRAQASEDRVEITVPPFARDVAFKVRTAASPTRTSDP